MALQTKTYTKSSNTYTLELTVVEQSTSTAGNTSTVSYTLKLKSTTKNFALYGVGAKVVLDGRTVGERNRDTAPKVTLGTYSEVTLLSGTATIAHNSDGSKSMPVAYSLDMATASYTPGPMSGSDTMALTRIPRGATITSAPDFDDESNPVVKYDNPAGVAVQLGIFRDSTHALADYRTVSGSPYTFRLTQKEREALQLVDTTKNTAQVRFYIKSTVGGQTFITYLTRTLTIKNPSPTLAPAVKDTNPATLKLTGDDGVMVRYQSTAQVTIGAKAVKGASLVSQSVTCGSRTLTGDGLMVGVESGTFVFTAKDSRGNLATKTLTKDVVEYLPLTCYIGQGLPDGQGNFNFAVSGAAFTGSFGLADNALTVEARYRLTGEDSWGAWEPMEVRLGASRYDATLAITGLDYTSPYDFQARATDLLSSVESSVLSIQAWPLFYYGPDGFFHTTPVYLEEQQADGTISRRSLDRCGITARIAATVPLTGGEKNIPVTLALCAYGGATVSNGAVVVKHTGVYEVSASVYFVSIAEALYCGAYIRSGGKELASLHTGIANGVGGVVVPPTLVELKEGSTVSLSAYVPSGGSATVNNDPRTQLTVRQVY